MSLGVAVEAANPVTVNPLPGAADPEVSQRSS